MQFSSIIAVLSLAFAASANPIEKRTTDSQCGQSNTVACCNSLSEGPTGNILPITALNGCVAVGVSGSGQCNTDQQLACCGGSTQTGNVVAVGSICAPISVA